MDTWAFSVVTLVLVGAVLLLIAIPGRGSWTVSRSIAMGMAGLSLASALVLICGPKPRVPPMAGSRARHTHPSHAMKPKVRPGVMTEEAWARLVKEGPNGPGSPGLHYTMRKLPAPLINEKAPDFTLPDIRTGEPVRLANLTSHRPLVLIFGSWGCNVFCGKFPALVELEKNYREKVDFLFVQGIEAPHPWPERLGEAYRAAGMEQETADNRLDRAALAADVMESPFRQLLDTPEGDASWKYKAFPERIFVIKDGLVAHDLGKHIPGKPGTRPFDQIHSLIASLVAE